MIEIGRLCLKIAGRDAGGKCVIIDILDKNFVLIDGETRRRRCNILHLEPLGKVLDIKKSASHQEVASALKNEGIESRTRKPKKPAAKPQRMRKTSEQLRQQKEQKKKDKPSQKAAAAKKPAEGLEQIAGQDAAPVENKERKKSPKKTEKKKEAKEKPAEA